MAVAEPEVPNQLSHLLHDFNDTFEAEVTRRRYLEPVRTKVVFDGGIEIKIVEYLPIIGQL